MSNFANWISPEILRTLGWTLLHFLWQGAGLGGAVRGSGSGLPKRIGAFTRWR